MTSIKQFLSPAQTNRNASIQETLGQVIGRLKGSHTPLYVYDQDNNFSGIFWLYHVLNQKQPHRENKIANFIVKPPMLTPDSLIFDVVEYMVRSRIYTLPVFTKERITAEINAIDIIKGIISDKLQYERTLENIKLNKPILVHKDSKLRNIYAMMRKTKLSRVILVDDHKKLAGVVSRKDLYAAYVLEIRSTQLSKKSGRGNYLSYDKEVLAKLDYPISKVATLSIQTADQTQSKRIMVENLISSQIGNIILINRQQFPQAILSIRSILKAIVALKSQIVTPVAVSDRRGNMSIFKIMELEDLLRNFTSKMKDRIEISKVDLVIDSSVKAGSKPNIFNCLLKVSLKNGQLLTSRTTGYNVREITREITSKIKRQIESQ